MKERLTAEQIIDIAQKENPGVRFGVYKGGTGVGVFTKATNSWHPVFAKMLDGSWSSVKSNYLVDGKPIWRQEDWTEYKVKMEDEH